MTRDELAGKTHEQTIESHVDSNVSMAIDQAHEYGGFAGAFDAFSQNTMDSVLEDGYSGDEAMHARLWFGKKFSELTAAK